MMCFLCKKKRRRDNETPDSVAEGPYGGQQQQNASRQLYHVVTSLSPPKPSSPPPHSSLVRSYSCEFEREKRRPVMNYSDHPVLKSDISKGTFTYEVLARATNGFSEANLLGKGGFGYVYKGILPNGKEIAVKQLKAESDEGDREFQAEVNIISRVHHENLVSLVGYYMDGVQRLLVFEFISNNDLEFHLHGKGRPPMEWSSRLKVAIGSAKGLSYLHENCYPKIIHRDIKAANILIDSKFEAKVADFGLAKVASDTNSHVSTRVMGTFGYLAPEYAASGHLSEKSDVYSFGVVLLELITGCLAVFPVDADNVHANGSLVDWARPLLLQAIEKQDFEVLVDTKLNNEYDKNEMGRMIESAAACVMHSARRRPRMDQVARALEGNIWQPDPN